MTEDSGKPRSAADRLLLERRRKKRRRQEGAEVASRAPEPTVPRRRGTGPAPASFAQERLWFLDRLQPDTSAYNVPVVLALEGPLDANRLARALTTLTRRQESLRTRLEAPPGGTGGAAAERDGPAAAPTPVQVIDPPAPVRPPWIDLGALGEERARREAARLSRAEARRPFRLSGGPLVRYALLRLAPGAHRLLLTLHHAVADGWSMAVVERELLALYAAAGDPSAAALPALPVGYADFATWQRRVLGSDGSGSDELERQLAHWRDRLDGAPPHLELPTDRPRGGLRRRRGERVGFHWPRSLATAVERAGRDAGASPFMVLLAAWSVLLGRLAGQDDVVVGVPIANRTRWELEHLVGFFANTLAVRVDWSPTTDVATPDFASLLARVRDAVLEDFAHQDLPFERLVADLQPSRDPAYTPIFQNAFVLQNVGEAGAAAAENTAPDRSLAVRRLDVHTGGARFDLTLNLVPRDGYRGSLEYDRDLFDRTTVERWLGALRRLLEAALAAPGRPVDELPLLSPAQRHQVEAEWAARPQELPPLSIPELFRRRAAEDGERTALLWLEEGLEDGAVADLSYGALDDRATTAARRLVAAGVKPGEAVALAAGRGPELVVAILAVLRAGAYYLPLDPAYPRRRLEWMLADTDCRLLVTDGGLDALDDAREDTGLPVLSLAALNSPGDAPAVPLPPLPPPEAAAYVMYTSGSTGRPKGVMVPHRAVVRLVWDNPFARMDAGHTWLLLAPTAFDASTLELWAPLLHGGRLALAPPGRLSPAELGAVIRRLGVTSAWLTAGLFHQLAALRVDALAPLRQLLAGGDVLSPHAVERVLEAHPHLTLINGYGPTENTTFTCCHTVARRDAGGAVPIGRPIAGTRVEIVDRHFRPRPAGCFGELCAGGDGLAHGYLGQPARTAELFVPDPRSGTVGVPAGSRFYRTGDRARWRGDGVVEFGGRLDRQVKIRGFRIEPGEVQAVLEEAPGVEEAAVVVRGTETGGGREQRLVGYAVPRAGVDLDADRLRTHLADLLPAYMVPSAVLFLDALPLTANGKLDRAALPDPEPAAGVATAEHVAPTGTVEELLAEVWQQVLGVDRVGARDDFFALGGHSLLATLLVTRVEERTGVALPLRTLFEHPRLDGLAAVLEGHLREGGAGGAIPTQPIPRRRDRTAPAPLSFAQERLWFLDRLQPGRATYNIPLVLEIRGGLDPGRLTAALAVLVRRQHSLRTRFHLASDLRPVQQVEPAAPFELPRVDLSALPAERAGGERRRLARAEARRPFRLDGGPLNRFRLLISGRRRHDLFACQHHAVSDGWSVGLLIEELAVLYAAGGDQPAALPPLPVQYADFAVWQRELLQGKNLERHLAHWRDRLDGAPTLLELPTDRPRPALADDRGARLPIHWPVGRAEAVEGMARRLSTSPFLLLLGVLQVLLMRLSGQRDVVVGAPVANRRHRDLEPLIGFFANTLALRTTLDAGHPSADATPFATHLERVRQRVLEDFAHQDLPFEELVNELEVERSLSHAPLFQVLFALQNTPPRPPRLPGLELRRLGADTATSKFDFTLALSRHGDGFRGELEYRTALFDRTTVERWLGHLEVLLAAAVEAPHTPLGELPLLTAAERHEILAAWNDTSRAYAAPEVLHDLVAAQVERTPEAPAVRFRDAVLSYRDLDRRANRLAHLLRRRGVGPEVRVGVAMERSPELVVALLAVLRAGGAYVPVDPEYPRERVRFMLADALGGAAGRGGGLLLSQEALRDGLEPSLPAGVELLAVEGLERELAELPEVAPAVAVDPENPAYAIYTSGSTGRPKGAVNRHRAIVNRLLWMQETFGLGADDRVLQKTPFSFDVSVWEFFWPLLAGAELVVAEPGGHKDPAYLVRTVREAEITTMHFVPSMLQAFVAERGVDGCGAVLRRVICSGEALPPELVRRFHELLRPAGGDPRLYNLYGPTEAAVDVTWVPCDDPEPRRVTLGRPVANTRMHVVDRRFRPQPVAVAGELLIGGVQLARGYLDRPGLTADRFVADPFAAELGVSGGRVYRTGDLGRYLPGGEIEYLGRLDHQVKIRGFRIELGEVETVLESHPSVAEGAVVVREDDPSDPRIVAYAVPSGDGEAAAAGLRAHLAAALPEYMVPAHFVFLDALPLTANGKLDRRALPAPDRRQEEDAFVAPESATERWLAALWRELLNIDRVGTGDDFFRLGGHSLLATMLAARVRRDRGIDLPLRTLFEQRRLGDLARAVEALGGEDGGADGADALAADAAGRSRGPLSFAQERLWFLDRLAPGRASYNIPLVLELEGELDPVGIAASLGRLIRRQASLRTRFAVDDDLRPVQVVDPPPAAPLARVDLSALPAEREDGERRRLIGAEARRPFHLDGGPLNRFLLLRRRPDRHDLLVTQHHAVSDGWSVTVLSRELLALYGEVAAGRPAALPQLPVQYVDFAVWQRRVLRGEEMRRQRRYWRRRLAGAPALLELPTDRPRRPLQRHRGGRVGFIWSGRRLAAVERLAGALSASPFLVLLAAWATLLGRLADQDDVVVGTPVANRGRLEVEHLIGFFVNTLALRVELGRAEPGRAESGAARPSEPGFAALVHRLRATVLEDFEHQDLPFEELLAELEVDRSLSHGPLFQVAFVLREERTERLPPLPGLEVRRRFGDSGAVKVDLSLGLNRVEVGEGERDVGYKGGLEYDRDLYDHATVERWSGHLETLLDAALEAPDTPPHALPLLRTAERRAIVLAGAGRAAPRPHPALLHAAVAARAAEAPEAPAVRFGDERLTYGELRRRATALAGRLRRRGVGPEGRVAVAMERCAELVVALLAILEAGAAWLPVDPDYPPRRVRHMLGDGLGRGGLLLTRDGLLGTLAPALPDGVETLVVEAPGEARSDSAPALEIPPGLTADSPAYVIYTSGSTGVPKGVVNRHRSILNRVLWMADTLEIGPGDRVLHKAPFSFDVSIWEIFCPLVSGAELIVAEPGGHREPAYLVRTIRDAGVTLAQFVPSLLATFLEQPGVEDCSGLRHLVASGEALPPELVRRFHSVLGLHSARGAVRLHNLYGPTETAVGVAWKECDDPDPRRVTLGRPIANTRLHVVDRCLEPCPDGVPGELVIAGLPLARGYLHRPGRTAAAFVPDPFHALLQRSRPEGSPVVGDGRLYRTGDRARRLPDGEIEFLGRLDGQVKMRGLRIELGEIEAALAALDGVGAAAVRLWEGEGGGPRLVAYLTATDGDAVAPDRLEAGLARRLPRFMIPREFLVVPSLPLGPSGKLDRAALPPPPSAGQGGAGARPPAVTPRSLAEEIVAELWSELLEVDEVGVHDDFFHLGGHSLNAAMLVARLERRTGVALPVRSVFELPVLADLAADLEERLVAMEGLDLDAGVIDVEAMEEDEEDGV